MTLDNFFLEVSLTVLSTVDSTFCTIVIYYKGRTGIKTIKYISLKTNDGFSFSGNCSVLSHWGSDKANLEVSSQGHITTIRIL